MFTNSTLDFDNKKMNLCSTKAINTINIELIFCNTCTACHRQSPVTSAVYVAQIELTIFINEQLNK